MPKKKSKQAQQPAAPMTKRQLSRWQKEKRQERLALVFVLATIVLVGGILIFGVWREILSRPGQVAGRVGDARNTLGSKVQEIKYRARTLDTQIALAQSQLVQARTQAQADPTSAFLVQYVEQQLQQLQLERFQVSNGQSVLEDAIEREIIKREAQRRGISVTAADIEAEIQRQFQPVPDETTDAVTTTTSTTDTVALPPAPTPTPIPADAWKGRYEQTLATYSISDAEFRRYTIEPLVWRTRMQEIIAASVPTTTEQVRARHILLATEQDARDALALLKEAPATFQDVAKARSTDDSNKDQGGDLGWFARGVMAPEFEAAAFALEPGQISDVVTTTFGFHIILVEEKDANRALDKDQLDSRIAQAFSDWLTDLKASPDIERYLDSDKQTWLNKQIPASDRF